MSKIDKLGRISIPKKLRKDRGWSVGTELEFLPSPETGGLILQKKETHACFFCGAGENLVEVGKDFFLCRACILKRALAQPIQK